MLYTEAKHTSAYATYRGKVGVFVRVLLAVDLKRHVRKQALHAFCVSMCTFVPVKQASSVSTCIVAARPVMMHVFGPVVKAYCYEAYDDLRKRLCYAALMHTPMRH